MNATPNPYGAPKVAVETAADTHPVRLFSISGRIGRLRYIAYGVLIYVVLVMLSGILSALLVPMGQAGAVIGALLPWAVIIVLSFMLTIQRCHDFNTTGWLSILGLVPLVNLIFWFIPGSDGPNRFGKPTPPNNLLTLILMWAVPLLLILLIAAIAIPAYTMYQQRAQQTQKR